MCRGIRVLVASALALPATLGMTSMAAASTHSIQHRPTTHSSVGSEERPLGGAGAAITAVNAALSKQGAPYAWGGKGPSSFDCSGLVQYAYQCVIGLVRS